jgi:hypothetical protein
MDGHVNLRFAQERAEGKSAVVTIPEGCDSRSGNASWGRWPSDVDVVGHVDVGGSAERVLDVASRRFPGRSPGDRPRCVAHIVVDDSEPFEGCWSSQPAASEP